METEIQFSVNVEPLLEVFHQYFVYSDHETLVIKDGFNGPTLESIEMHVNDLTIFNNQLLICASEGILSLNASGEMITLTEQYCESMAVDNQNRLFLQGVFGPHNYATSYDIFEFKNNTIVPFTRLPNTFNCVTVDLESGMDQSLYAISCNGEVAHYKNGVVYAEFDEGEAPFLSTPMVFDTHNGELIAMIHSNFNHYQMFRLVDQDWQAIYNLEYEGEGPKDEKALDVFLHIDYNTLIVDDYLYTFSTGGPQDREGIGRYDISGNEEKTLDDMELVVLPGIASRKIIDIVIASDGSAYAVLSPRKIIKISC
jgi:hypothetical protein